MAFGGQTVKGPNVTLLDSTPAIMPDSSKFHGRLYNQTDTYEAATLTAGSYIAMARLPKGAVVKDGFVMCDALGASMTVTVGDSFDTDRFLTSISAMQGVGAQNNGCGRFNAIDGIGYKYTCEKDILVCVGDATTATGTITLSITYQLEG
jgi:hypothetical protein